MQLSKRLLISLLIILFTATTFAEETKPLSEKYAIIIHGGAGGIASGFDDARRASQEKTLAEALRFGAEQLKNGASGLDVVEQVLNRLEDNPNFNAGKGAVYNANGKHELDASIMDGRTRACGAVGGVMTVKNPISLARLVMTETRHVLLVADGAEKFADEMQVARVPTSYFDTEHEWKDLQRVIALEKEKEIKEKAKEEDHLGTVGCVVLDRHGNLAAGTSTGGLTNKKYGRVGDSPIISAGTYADNDTCAVSCTGVGEDYIRNAVAYDVSARMSYKKSTVTDAVHAIITNKKHAVYGGIIAVSHDGTTAVDFNTPGMTRGIATWDGTFEVKLGGH